MTTAKINQKAQKQLGILRKKNGWGCCWICGSTSGVKTSREGYGTRCRKCRELGKETPDTILYEQLKNRLVG